MQNEKPQFKNQDSGGGMGNFSSMNLFAYNTLRSIATKHEHCPHYANPHYPTIVENVRQIGLFLQNKANFENGQMYVKSFLTRIYENITAFCRRKPKPKQTQTKTF